MSWLKNSRGLEVPAKRYRIGELVRYSPFSRQTIHNYTIMGLIREAEWTEGGHRLYDESVFARLARIMELKETLSLTEIRRVLRQEDTAEPPQRSYLTGSSHLQDTPRGNAGSRLYEQGEDFVADTR
jgi:DNA-binding transcriptional MerR regulator